MCVCQCRCLFILCVSAWLHPLPKVLKTHTHTHTRTRTSFVFIESSYILFTFTVCSWSQPANVARLTTTFYFNGFYDHSASSFFLFVLALVLSLSVSGSHLTRHLDISSCLFLAPYMGGSKENMGGKRIRGNTIAVKTSFPLSNILGPKRGSRKCKDANDDAWLRWHQHAFLCTCPQGGDIGNNE